MRRGGVDPRSGGDGESKIGSGDRSEAAHRRGDQNLVVSTFLQKSYFFINFLDEETKSVQTKHINQAGFIPHIQTEENFT